MHGQQAFSKARVHFNVAPQEYRFGFQQHKCRNNRLSDSKNYLAGRLFQTTSRAQAGNTVSFGTYTATMLLES